MAYLHQAEVNATVKVLDKFGKPTNTTIAAGTIVEVMENPNRPRLPEGYTYVRFGGTEVWVPDGALKHLPPPP